MTIATRTVALTDAARFRFALQALGVRVAVQCDDDTATLIYSVADAQVVADVIADELSR
jgi:hypothetical protein